MPTEAADIEFYYNSKGEKISLQRAPHSFVVRFRPGERSESVALSEPAKRLLREQSDHVQFIPRYGIQIFQIKPQIPLSALESMEALPLPSAQPESPAAELKTWLTARVARSLMQEPVVEMAAPVYHHPGNPADLVLVTEQFIAEFKPGVTDAQIDALNEQYDVQKVERLGYVTDAIGYVLAAPATEGPSGPIELSKRYYESGLVRYAIPDLVRSRSFRLPPDVVEAGGDVAWQYQNEQWHLPNMGITRAWETTLGAPTVVVVILDDGVDTQHPEFVGRVVSQYDFEGDVPDASPKTNQDNHGTACAGVAVAGGQARGSAPGCSLMAVRSPAFLGSADEARMFQWVADNGASVMSCSWGPPDGTGLFYPQADNVASALHYCVTHGRSGKGIPIFWAAGNGNELVSNDGYSSNPDVMAIAACTEHGERAYYSDYGPEVWLCAPSSGRKADGDRRVFTVDRQGSLGYNPGNPEEGDAAGNYSNNFGGTSSAAPLAAGVGALMLSVNPDLTNQDVRAILRDTAEKIGPPGEYDAAGHSPNFGYGRIDAHKAVAEALKRKGSTNSTPTGLPTITGPAKLLRSDAAPTFTVSGGSNPYYAVEIVTDPSLFDQVAHGSERTDDNFHASWQNGGLIQTPTYTLPDAAWTRLKPAARLYYRLVTSASRTAWVSTTTTTPVSEASSAPFILLEPSIQGPADVSRAAPPPTFSVASGSNPFWAVELARETSLFSPVNSAARTAQSFYASWQHGGLQTGAQFVVPAADWAVLTQGADRLYYRVLTSSASSSWTNVDTSTEIAQIATAPSVALVDRVARSERDDLAPPVADLRDRAAKPRRVARVVTETRLPAITGPEAVDRNSGVAPTFVVWPGGKRFFAVEIAADAASFAPDARNPDRAPQKFFSSWSKGLMPAGDGPNGRTIYTVPLHDWLALTGAARLFYRVVTSALPDRWADTASSYPAPGAAAPQSLSLMGAHGVRMLVSRSRWEERLWRDDH